MRTKKSLSQHFLKSKKALTKIVEAGKIARSETVIEIGPGKGALTEQLLGAGCKVLAIEKDDNLYECLREKFGKKIESEQLELRHGDVLELNPPVIKYKLISNIPYNITGKILKKFLSAFNQPTKAILLVQKEVAERIIGKKPRSAKATRGKESILSISVKAYGMPKYIETVKASSFIPVPEVDSAILSIENISKDFFSDFSEENFFKLLRVAFQAKRKKLSSNLATIAAKEKVRKIFDKLGLDANIRAEDISIATWQKLARELII